MNLIQWHTDGYEARALFNGCVVNVGGESFPCTIKLDDTKDKIIIEYNERFVWVYLDCLQPLSDNLILATDEYGVDYMLVIPGKGQTE